jgi:putative ABC transport system permease protein
MRRNGPPAIAVWILLRLLPGEWADTILGDLHEEHRTRSTQSPRLAALWYWCQAARLSTRYAARSARDLLTLHTQPQLRASKTAGTLDRDRREANVPRNKRDSLMRTLGIETRYALRSLIKQPGFAGIIVLTLGVGIGANAVVFDTLDSIVIRPFHFPDIDRQVLIAETSAESSGDTRETSSPANFLDWKAEARTIERLTAFDWWDVNLVGRDEPERVQGFRVSADFFPALGVQPALGRSFTADEETPGRSHRVVISHGLWKRRLAGDPSVIGQTITLDVEPYEVIGVAPEGFDFPMGAELWTPLAFSPQDASLRSSHYLTTIGRLAPGRSIEDARAEMELIAARLEQLHPETNKGRGARVITLTEGMKDDLAGSIVGLWQASAIFVLLIGCANIVNLLLARGTGRQRDVAVRLAMGASRGRVARELMIEHLLLALSAVPVSLLVAWVGLNLVRAEMPARIVRFVPGWDSLGIDVRLIAMSTALAVVAAFVFGLLPAIRTSRGNLAESLRDGGRSATAGRSRHTLRRALVIAEMTLALPLLVASGMGALSAYRFLHGPQGYDPENVLSMHAVLPDRKYSQAAVRRAFVDDVLQRVTALATVHSAAIVNIMPSHGNNSTRDIEVEGQPIAPSTRPPNADARSVTEGLFETLRIPILSGRGFTAADRDGSELVAIVSQSLARRSWPGSDPIGRRIRIGTGPWLTVVGVCGDIIQDWYGRRNYPTLYRPYAQAPTTYLALLIRTNGEPTAIASDVREAVRAVDSGQPFFDVASMRRLLSERTIGLQYAAGIMLSFAALALLLAIVGVYSAMAYFVSQRTQEIGVRMALGATRADVLRLTIGQTIRLASIGVGLGVVISALLGRLIEAGLLGTASTDPRLVAACAAGLAAAAVAAAYLPARRAAAIDPAEALRQ